MNDNEMKNESLEDIQVASESVEQTNENVANALVEGVMHEQNIQTISRRQTVLKILSQIGIYAFLSVMALIVVFPFYWMLISSVKSIEEYELMTPTLWPQEFHFETYAKAFNAGNLGRLFLNTAYVGIVSTFLSLIITVLSAFAFARLDFKGKDTLFAVLLSTMMIPGELFTITNFQMVNDIGWTDFDTYGFTVLIVPFLVSIFYIYLLKQNFMQIPNEL